MRQSKENFAHIVMDAYVKGDEIRDSISWTSRTTRTSLQQMLGSGGCLTSELVIELTSVSFHYFSWFVSLARLLSKYGLTHWPIARKADIRCSISAMTRALSHRFIFSIFQLLLASWQSVLRDVFYCERFL